MSWHNGATGTAGSHARAMPPPKPLRDPRTQPARGPCSRLLPPFQLRLLVCSLAMLPARALSSDFRDSHPRLGGTPRSPLV